MKRWIKKLKESAFTLLMIGGAFLAAGFVLLFFLPNSIARLRENANERFMLQVNSLVSQSEEKYNGGATTLRSLQGFFAGSQNVTREEFEQFIKVSKFVDGHPGYSVFAYIQRVDQLDKTKYEKIARTEVADYKITPEESNNEYWPILYVSPRSYDFLLGQDQNAEETRQENLVRARDLGDISISKPLELSQGGYGVIIAAPLYKNQSTGGEVPTSLEKRKEEFTGAVTLSLVINDFFEDIFTPSLDERDFNLSIRGRNGQTIPIKENEISNNFATRLYGTINITEAIKMDNGDMVVEASAPAIKYLSSEEIREPIILSFVAFGSAIFMSVVIVLTQRAKRRSDLEKRYKFLTILSHQLRTPLTNLRWYVESMKVAKDQDETHNLLTSNVIVLNAILSQMLLFIDISEKGLKLEIKEIKFEDLYKLVLDTVANDRNTSRIKKSGSVSELLEVDTTKIIPAISAVIENALIYSPEEKPVEINVSKIGNSISIQIKDFGYGIPIGEKEHIFEDFFRASNASFGLNYGSGVSLSMSKKIIEAHGGKISFVSKEDAGSTFTIDLPLLKKSN